MKSVNQVAPSVDNFGVDFTPSEFKIGNYEAMLQQVSEFAASFDHMAVSEDTLKDAKDARAKLNKFKDAVEQRRIEIHNAYEKPYDDFKVKIDALLAGVDSAYGKLGGKINQVNDQLKEVRAKSLTAAIAEMAPKYGIEPNDIEIDSKWLAKNQYKSSDGTPTLGLTRLIGGAMQAVVDARKAESDRQARIETEKLAVNAIAEVMELQPEAWLQLIDNGVSLADVQAQMKQAVTARKLKAEKEAREAEARSAVENAKRQEIGTKTIDRETGEVLSDTRSDEHAPEVTMNQQPVEVPDVDLEDDQTAPSMPMDRDLYSLQLMCTPEEFESVQDFMKLQGIQYQIGE
jgi:DNA-binding transcriptional MerR regulator